MSVFIVPNNSAKTAVAPSNLVVLAAMGGFTQQVGLYACVGAAGQMEPSVISGQTMLLETLAMDIRCSSSGLGTCLSAGGKCSSNIEDFVMHNQLCDVCEQIAICDSMPSGMHRPVRFLFWFGPSYVQVQVFKEPNKLFVDPPIGSFLPPHMFSDYSEVVEPFLPSLKPAGGDFHKQ